MRGDFCRPRHTALVVLVKGAETGPQRLWAMLPGPRRPRSERVSTATPEPSGPDSSTLGSLEWPVQLPEGGTKVLACPDGEPVHWRVTGQLKSIPLVQPVLHRLHERDLVSGDANGARRR